MAAYLEWLKDVFEEAQVDYTPATAPALDALMRRLVSGETASEEEVYRRVRDRWLRHGLPGRQLLTAFIRDEAYSRRDSVLRPVEGTAYYTNAYQTTSPLPRRS